MNKDNIKLGIAPINWTNDDMPELGADISFEQCINEMSEAGYVGCEIGTKYPTDRVELKAALDRVGLVVCNQWFSTFFLSKPAEETYAALRKTCEFLQFMGAKAIGASEQSGSIQGQMATPLFGGAKPVIKDVADWKKICSAMSEAGKIALEEYGIKFCYHHHLGTVIENCEETERLLDGTDERYFSLVFDTGHLFAVNEDPTAAIKKYVSRVGHVHLKDVRASVLEKVNNDKLSFLDGVKEGLFTVPGDGVIDFSPVFETLDGDGYTGWMVVEAEQDPAKANPLEYAMKGRKYIRENAGI